MEVLDIFGLLHPKFKLKPPIRLFEAFSGIGTQAMALKRITDDYEIVGFSEIDPHAIRSYQAIHGEHIKNYGDITKMEIIPECDIFTWSFPCTDISKAGQNKGLSKKTRSGLVYEVLNLLERTSSYVPHRVKHGEKSTIHSDGLPTDYHKPFDKGRLPKVLIMENVPDLIQEKYRRQFAEIHHELETYGYMNYVETLNAKDYNVAQNRNRVFMVSILGDYSYTFPRPLPSERRVKRLKDYLEPQVDKKYYLTEKQLGQIANWKSYQNPLDNVLNTESISPTITTRVAETDAGGISASMIVFGEPVMNYDPRSREYKDNVWSDIAQTLVARDYKAPKIVAIPTLKIPEDTLQGYAEAEEGDGVYINRPEQKRGVVQKGMIQTFKANNSDIGVVVKDDTLSHIPKVTNNKPELELAFQMDGYEKAGRVYSSDGISPTIDTMTGGGREPKIFHNLTIRKLTPRECWRLMGIDDRDFDKAQEVNSNSQLYKQAGNAIVVDVFEAILREMIDLDGDENE